jgi:hypothetical protein
MGNRKEFFTFKATTITPVIVEFNRCTKDAVVEKNHSHWSAL